MRCETIDRCAETGFSRWRMIRDWDRERPFTLGVPRREEIGICNLKYNFAARHCVPSGITQRQSQLIDKSRVLPGLAATALIGFVDQEKTRTPVPHASFGERLRGMPQAYRQFLVAVGIFGAGGFSHPLLILFSRHRLALRLSAVVATSAAVAPYLYVQTSFSRSVKHVCFSRLAVL